MKNYRRNKKTAPDISVLSLIDVAFTLVVFFLVTTTFNLYTQFNIDLPTTSYRTYDVLAGNKIEVLMDRNKKLFLKKGEDIKEVSMEVLQNEIVNLSEQEKERVSLIADKSLTYETVIDLMARLKFLGVKHVNLNTQREHS